jgi:prevent-host-death family protein
MKINIHAAKTNLSKLIERAQSGEEVIISRDDVPVARLVPIVGASTPKRRPGTLKGIVKLTPAFFDPLPPDELDLWEGKGS